MIFGYTLLDPVVVLLGTLLAFWYLSHKPVKLVGFLPTAFSLWFFLPILTNMSLWQTVPLLLTGRLFVKGGARMPQSAQATVAILASFFIISSTYALLAGEDTTRVVIRIVYYLGIFATFVFCCEMGRRPEAYEILLKGLAAMGIIYAAYGAYQIVAFYTGLPLRGIVYSASGGGIMAFEAGLLRINSLANEPKRLGYVLFLAAMACMFLARMRRPRRARQLRLAAIGILAISTLTFAASYFTAVALFGLGVLLLYPSRATTYAMGALALLTIVSVLFPALGILDALQSGYERRMDEVEVGLDGKVVYRQEFFAIEYLKDNPVAVFGGVGIGQYYSVLNENYGTVAGYDEYGGLIPINSNALELVLDFGIIPSVILYGGLIALVVRLRRGREDFLSCGLLFLIMQSFSIINLLYMVLFAGVAVGRLAQRQQIQRIVSSGMSQGRSLILQRP